MANPTYWQLIQQASLARISLPVGYSKVPMKSTPVQLTGFSARVQISSQKGRINPNWQTGGYAFWGINSVSGFERIIEPRSISLPINTPAIILVPGYLKEPWLQIEIPSWIPDAVLSVWQVSTDPLLQGPNPVPIINPPSLPSGSTPEPTGGNVGTMSEVFSTTEYFQLLAANPARKGFYVKNESADKFLFLILAETGDAIKTAIKLLPGGVYEDTDGFYTGVVRGFMEANTAGQTILVNEITYSA